jgi:hypothetical protein
VILIHPDLGHAQPRLGRQLREVLERILAAVFDLHGLVFAEGEGVVTDMHVLPLRADQGGFDATGQRVVTRTMAEGSTSKSVPISRFRRTSMLSVKSFVMPAASL